MNKKINYDEFIQLYNIGLTDNQLKMVFSCHIESVRIFRRNLNLKANRQFINISDIEKQIIIGTLLGDGSLQLFNSGRVSGKIEHGQKQLDYLKYKKELIGGVSSFITLKDRYDKRTNKVYNTCWFTLHENPFLKEIYKDLYVNNKKIISQKILDLYFTELSLAILFQDDGNKTRDKSFEISLCSFDLESLNLFISFLKNKYDLDCTIRADHKIYIRRLSCDRFIKLIKQYIHPSMQYKIAHVKSDKLLENLEADNQQPIISLND